MGARILVVEDENDIAYSLSYLMEKEGFATRVAADGAAAIAATRSWQPDIVLLDLMLPDVDGFSVCRALHQQSTAGIIVVTARTSEVDRVVGLELGADDYVCKPFNTRELIARVRAVLRRTRDRVTAESNLISGDLELQSDSHKVFLRGAPVDLTLKEFELLQILMTHKGCALSRDRLYQDVWSESLETHSRTLDAHVHSLREKIEKNPDAPQRIVTVRGVGYRFEE